jgi:hypothetical protein
LRIISIATFKQTENIQFLSKFLKKEYVAVSSVEEKQNQKINGIHYAKYDGGGRQTTSLKNETKFK